MSERRDYNNSSPVLPPPLPERGGVSGSSSDGNTQPPALPPRSRPIQTTSLPPAPLPAGPPLTAPLPAGPPDTVGPVPVKSPVWLVSDCAVKEETTLQALSERPDALPAVIRFVDGYYGHALQFSVSAGDCYQANFVKRTEVLILNDRAAREYTVPLTSSVKLGLLYKDTGPITIPTLLAVKSLPRIICALKGFENKKASVKISKGDQIIIKSREQKVLNCHNVTTGADLVLQKSCSATFSLDPDAIKMCPLEIVNHLPDVFPCHAKVYYSDSTADVEGLQSFSEKPVTIRGCSIDVSLVATDMAISSEKESNVIHFPLDQNLRKLRVEVLNVEDQQHVYDHVNKPLQSCDPITGLVCEDKETDDIRLEEKKAGRAEPLTRKEETKPEEKKNNAPVSAVYDVITDPPPQRRRPPEKLKPSPSTRRRTHATATNAPVPNTMILHNPHLEKPGAETVTSNQMSTRDSGSESDEYTDIHDAIPSLQSLSKCPTLKPSDHNAIHKPPLHQDVHGPTTLPTQIDSSSGHEYAIIPVSGSRPTAKPRRQSKYKSVADKTSHETVRQPSATPLPNSEPTPGGYITLYRNSATSANETTQQATPQHSSPQSSPVPTQRQHMLTEDELQEENKAFLRTMDSSQVTAQLCYIFCYYH